MTSATALTALALNCTLKPGSDESSTQLMAEQVLAGLGEHGVTGEVVRVVDHDVRPGVLVDMGEGDAWPAIRQKMIDADILVLATPTWLGSESSVCRRVLERLDGELSETDDEGRLETFGKVALVVAVGNEDGAHKIVADLYQALVDCGFSIPAQGAVYWNGEAMTGTDYKDLGETPEAVATTMQKATTNAAHLARQLRAAPYPPPA